MLHGDSTMGTQKNGCDGRRIRVTPVEGSCQSLLAPTYAMGIVKRIRNASFVAHLMYRRLFRLRRISFNVPSRLPR